ncbi:MAG: Rieske (2Fe-2S) protein [Phycisphaeraceae bacterium]|nr:Rieske (2Fe-2S) protein [Phycisphaeraceae bacterium]
MAKWIPAPDVLKLENGKKACVMLEGQAVTVCRVGDQFHAFENMCPHAGLPLGEGPLQGKVITCPFHGYSYHVDSGKNVDFEDDIPLRVMPVRQVDGRVEVDVDAS